MGIGLVNNMTTSTATPTWPNGNLFATAADNSPLLSRCHSGEEGDVFESLDDFLNLSEPGRKQSKDDTVDDAAEADRVSPDSGESVFSMCCDRDRQLPLDDMESGLELSDEMWDLASQMDLASQNFFLASPELKPTTPKKKGRKVKTEAALSSESPVAKRSQAKATTKAGTQKTTDNYTCFDLASPMQTTPVPQEVCQQQQLTALIGETVRSIQNGQDASMTRSASSTSLSTPTKRSRPRAAERPPSPESCSENPAKTLSWGSIESAQTIPTQTPTKRVKGAGHKYICGYCSKVKVSASACSDGRVRIRCECGGQYQDNKPRMHATWSAVDPEAVAKAASAQKNVKREIKRQVKSPRQQGGAGGGKQSAWIFVDEAAAMSAPSKPLMYRAPQGPFQPGFIQHQQGVVQAMHYGVVQQPNMIIQPQMIQQQQQMIIQQPIIQPQMIQQQQIIQQQPQIQPQPVC